MAAEIPVTYVPARNTVVSWRWRSGWPRRSARHDLVAGMNAVDYSGYPDCRPEFIRGVRIARAARDPRRRRGRRLHACTRRSWRSTRRASSGSALSLGVDFALTHSCYDPAPDGAACGRCDACVLRARGFHEAGVPDPTRYAAQVKA